MKFSEIALKVLAATECGIIRSNTDFWSKFSNRTTLEIEIKQNVSFNATFEKISKELESSNNDVGIICAYDDKFPYINKWVKNNSEKPYLLFYRGDIELLSDLNNNVAVIGLTNPEEGIIERETEIVKRLTSNDLVIVSGLAKGCDTIAHRVCLEANGKTIAILPSTLDKVYPAENRQIAEDIVSKGGLLITEYYKEPASKYEAIKRFIDRDRLQAMFSKAIILTASYRKGEGDSGSRHAMEAAAKYKIARYAIYNYRIDADNKQFGLNKDLINSHSVKVLTRSSIDDIKSLKNPNLYSAGEQMTIEDYD